MLITTWLSLWMPINSTTVITAHVDQLYKLLFEGPNHIIVLAPELKLEEQTKIERIFADNKPTYTKRECIPRIYYNT